MIKAGAFIGVISGGLLVWGATPLLNFLGSTGGKVGTSAVLTAGASYLKTRALAMPFAMIIMACIGVNQGMLDTKTPVALATLTNIVNLVLSPLLIFGWPG